MLRTPRSRNSAAGTDRPAGVARRGSRDHQAIRFVWAGEAARQRRPGSEVAKLGCQPCFGRGIARVAGQQQRQHPWTHPLGRSEEHTSELQSLMRISYAVFCLKKKKQKKK